MVQQMEFIQCQFTLWNGKGRGNIVGGQQIVNCGVEKGADVTQKSDAWKHLSGFIFIDGLLGNI